MEPKHTPGPWRVEDPLGPETVSVVAGGHETYEWKLLAGIPTDDEDISPAEALANARLMAAAPDLLDALRDTLNMLQAAHMQCGIHHEGHKRVIKARAALALARGGQS